MAKSADQKQKLLYLCRILIEQTDEEHPLTVPQLIAALARLDVKAERKSIYADLEALSRCGLDIHSRKGKSPGWFVGERLFQLPELKLLVDAVQSSRFITQKKSNALVRKLEGLASVHQARQLQRQVCVSGRVRVMNESIYCTVDKLHAAITARRAITFRYFDYDMYRKKVFHRDGKRYHASPYGLIWAGESYYLAAYDHQSGEMRHYRVDRMAETAVTCLPRMGEEQYPDFDVSAYGQKHFSMCGGQEATVCLRAKRHMAGVLLDRFGQDAILIPDGPEHFTVTLPVVVSPQFFGWLFGLEDNVALLSPPDAAAAYRDKLRGVLALYEEPKNCQF